MNKKSKGLIFTAVAAALFTTAMIPQVQAAATNVSKVLSGDAVKAAASKPESNPYADLVTLLREGSNGETEFSIDNGKTWMNQEEYLPIQKEIDKYIIETSTVPVARPSETRSGEAEYTVDNGKTWMNQEEFSLLYK
ncbi:hypothetical protein JNUCC42_00365 [Brevibacterium sp. JNUCC-42]|nr:hypothetical protein JNUCC42_00365 [Brevibacterium sp. JNUCC-42]